VRGVLLAASFIAQICSVSAREIAPADTVLVNGQLITVDPNDRLAQALAIRQGKIIRVGTDREVRRLIGPKTTVIDLHERAATPGLIDAHAHVLNTGLVELFEIDLSHAASIAEITAALAKRVAKARVGEWVVGSGWDEGKLLERRYPTAEELDAAAPGTGFSILKTPSAGATLVEAGMSTGCDQDALDNGSVAEATQTPSPDGAAQAT